MTELVEQVERALAGGDLDEEALVRVWNGHPRRWRPADAGWTYRAWFETIVATLGVGGHT